MKEKETPSIIAGREVFSALWFFDAGALILAFIGVFLTVLGGLAHEINVFHTTIDLKMVGRSIGFALFFAFCLYMAVLLTFRWADYASWHVSSRIGVRDIASANGITGKAKNFAGVLLYRCEPMTFTESVRRLMLPFWGITFLCWIPWLIIYWPGSMRDDTIAQLLQSSGLHGYYTQHPLFDTFFFGIFWKIGDALGDLRYGLGAYSIFQTLTLSMVVALVLCYLRKIGVPRLFVFISLVFFSTSYVIVGVVPTMSKDSLHAVFMVPLALLFIEGCRTRGTVFRRKPVVVLFVALIALSVMTKRTGLAVIVCGALFLIVTSKGNRLRIFISTLIAVLLVQCVWNPVSARFTDADESPSKEVYGLITQPIGRVQARNPAGITEHERELLSDFMDVEAAGDLYNPWRTDETVWSYKEDATLEDTIDAIKAWRGIGLRNIEDYVIAYTGFTYGWFYVRQAFSYPSDLRYLFTDGYMEQWRSYNENPAKIDDLLSSLRKSINRPQWVKDAVQDLSEQGQQKYGNPLKSMALYVTYIPLAAGLYLLTRKRWHNLAAWLFLGFEIVSLYLSPMALFWYPIAVYFMLPAFIGLIFVPDLQDGKAGKQTKQTGV